MRRRLIVIALFLLVLLSGPVYFLLAERPSGQRWFEASKDSAKMAPDPAAVRDAVVQVYVARAWGWRGAFAVHSWIAVKPTASRDYTVYQVIGWRQYYDRTVLTIRKEVPDRFWYGNQPQLLTDLRGEGVDDIIQQIHEAALSYPFPDEYRVWPGPNSNTFVAWVARKVPALGVDLPPTSIGKDWLGGARIFARSPSGTGFQISLLGVLGFTVGVEEGIEFNVGGAHFGIDPLALAVRLPGWGIVGLRGFE